jgi:hypothetical protein
VEKYKGERSPGGGGGAGWSGSENGAVNGCLRCFRKRTIVLRYLIKSDKSVNKRDQQPNKQREVVRICVFIGK